MKTILLAGYRHDENLDLAPGLQVDAQGRVRLDQRIEQLSSLGFEIICVLAGPAAEQQMRRSKRLEEVELVFDNNDRDANLVTNLRAGLVAAGHDPCFCLPVEIPWPPEASWAELSRISWTNAGTASLAQLRTGTEDVLDFGFPLLITRRGTQQIAHLDDLISLADPRLEYLYLNV